MNSAQEEFDQDDGPIHLGGDESSEDERDLGPDEFDSDLLDGTWEQQYYAGKLRSVDWHNITIALGLLALIAMVVPLLLVFLN
ncbi:MAG: hypothetical protein ABI305_09250 [Tepidiformaceae bacterium]